MKTTNLTLIFLTFVCFLNAQIYNEDDKEGLRVFFAQPSAIEDFTNGAVFGLTQNDMQFWYDNETWVSKIRGVRWNNSSPKRLIELFCFRSGNLAGVLDAGKWSEMLFLDCSQNQLTDLYANGCTNLKTLNCYDNKLSNLYICGCPNLEELNCSKNLLINLNLGCTNLLGLDCNNNLLTYLDLSELNLFSLNCSDNYLSNLELSSCEKLSSLKCANNFLTNLDVSGCSLWDLSCQNNLITNLDVSGNFFLGSLYCYNNSLTSLNVRGCKNLCWLYCYSNSLTSLDVRGCESLWLLNCSNNSLTNLDIRGCNYLQDLNCSKNSLTNIDVSECSNLLILNCSNNSLINLNVGRLIEIYCNNNKLKLSNLYDISENVVTQSEDYYKILGTQTLLPQVLAIDEKVDFSKEAILGGVETIFVVQKNGENVVTEEDYTVTDGIFSFHTHGVYTVILTNAAIFSDINNPAKVIAEFNCVINSVQKQSLIAYVQNGVLYVSELSSSEKWNVYNTSGIFIAEGKETGVILPYKGVYIVKSGKRSAKVVF